MADVRDDEIARPTRRRSPVAAAALVAAQAISNDTSRKFRQSAAPKP
jgi:hypothetical protein